MNILPIAVPLWFIVWALFDIKKSLQTIAYHSVPLRHQKEKPDA